MVEIVDAVELNDGQPRARFPFCGPVAAGLKVNISDQNGQEIVMVAWELHHEDRPSSCVAGALQAHRSILT